MKELVIISGPTAAGKSDLAVGLAKMKNGAVISADSMQVYKGMDIGTAKLKEDQMQGIRHYMIDILDPKDDFNVSIFQEKAREYIGVIKKEGMLPIIAGGTGFYTKALLYGADFEENETDEAIRKKLEDEGEIHGLSYLEDRLKRIDPISAEKYRGNKKRIIRALEYNELTGQKMSDKNMKENMKAPVYDALHFLVTMPRDILYERINLRVDNMIRDGLLEEAKSLYDSGIKRSATSMQALGYKQLFEYFDGLVTYEQALDNIKKETRHFAKRQLTWFRSQKDIITFDRTEYESDEMIIQKMAEYIG